ncbi:MAG: hypothetical protein DRJ42_22120 [Deltaproteobacteria bacterium]|nr:MAG: hypothetical protein DRJ42_22120 [Deltaproteobacteria bacterium]
MLARYFRVFKFAGEVLGMVKANPTLAAPMGINLAVAVPVNIALAIAYSFAGEGALGFIILGMGVTALYFIDYFCAGLAVSLIYDQVTTNDAKMGPAFSRTLKATPGILVFATVSAALDLAASYAQEQGGIVGTIVLRILRVIWTTATYVVLPAMVIEGMGFFPAFKRSKDLMAQDPTQVGVGIIGLGVMFSLLSLVTIGVGGWLAGVISSLIHPILGGLVFFTMVNVYWSLSGYLRSTYYTCFYLWARECERNGAANPAFAPAPLQTSIADAYA